MQVLVKNWLVGAEKTEVAHLWAAVNVWLKYRSCLVDSKCSFSHRCSTESSFVHIAKKLRVETFIAATQPMAAKNHTGFTKDAFNMAFWLV